MEGCAGKPKEQTKPINHIASSSTKEDKEVIKQKHFLSEEHEQDMTTLCESTLAAQYSIGDGWDSIKTVVGGNGTPQGGDNTISLWIAC